MNRRWMLIVVGGFTALIVFWSEVQAGLLSPNGEEEFERMDQPWNIGFSFIVNDEPIPINALGVWEDSDGLNNDIEVGIWLDFEDDPIATAIVPAGDGGILEDGFRYVPIDAIVLDPHEEYVVGALTSYDGDAFNDPYNIANDLTASGFDIDPRIEWLQNRYAFGTDALGDLIFQKPTLNGTGGIGRWAGGNATFLDLEVVEGDFNDNGDLDAGDVNLLSDEIKRATHDTSFDLNSDGEVNANDLSVWVVDLKNTWFGDANLDGEFASGDMVQVFVRGKYETGQTAGWEDGDWNGDKVFGSGDMVVAFVGGGYEQGLRPKAAVSAVPEPSSLALLVSSLLLVSCWRTRKKRTLRW